MISFLPSGRIRRMRRQVLIISGVWMLVGVLDGLNIQAVFMSEMGPGYFPFEVKRLLLVKGFAGLAAGMLSGSLLIFFLRERVRHKSFGFAILVNSLIISLVNFGIIVLIYRYLLPLNTSNLYFFLKTLTLWFLVVFITIVALHVNEKYGPGVLLKLLLGRYHKPREEERIFMFVDIKSSSMIAERLGHIRFFNLLNDFFRDVTAPVVYSHGEVYQYVGDEIVVSWTLENGLRDFNCLKCFYGMQEAIQKVRDRYQHKYGLVPEFKAGLHGGCVTTGEIGVIKKDIVFSGDVLNTTARIQNKCNQFGVNILLSRYLLNKLQLPPSDFSVSRVGVIELKGKKQKLELFTLDLLPIPAIPTAGNYQDI